MFTHTYKIDKTTQPCNQNVREFIFDLFFFFLSIHSKFISGFKTFGKIIDKLILTIFYILKKPKMVRRIFLISITKQKIKFKKFKIKKNKLKITNENKIHNETKIKQNFVH